MDRSDSGLNPHSAYDFSSPTTHPYDVPGDVYGLPLEDWRRFPTGEEQNTRQKLREKPARSYLMSFVVRTWLFLTCQH
ncbi:hypothetical protein DL95DRAFT_389491 [Leptodontidium sp. 2 PMI_412]|nr:hypothetical protein DL95DRAFT_389491 [Leptodontidium sp. 2 PMI_412]